MAGRIVFNNLNRKVHFFAGIIVFIFALFYSVSGIIMSQNKWFPAGNVITTVERHALNYQPDTTDLANFGKEIKQQFALSGRVEYHRNRDNSINFFIYRPGIRNEIFVQQKLDTIIINRIERKSIHEISTRLHRLHNFNGGWQYVIWAFFLDITAIAFILFAITGIFLWFRNWKVFKFGWFLLIPILFLTLIMFVYLH